MDEIFKDELLKGEKILWYDQSESKVMFFMSDIC